MSEKIFKCYKCKVFKAQSEFNKCTFKDWPSRIVQLNCRPCERARLAIRRKTPANIEYMKKYLKEYNKRRDPQKVRARQMVSEAIKAGKMKRSFCEICGSVKVQAHHTDYSKPLDVRWLCHIHHAEIHRVLVH